MTNEQLENYLTKQLTLENLRNEAFAEPECSVRDESLGTSKGAEGHAAQAPRRIKIRFVTYRHRLLDPDNPCPKSFIDGLRYAGLIPDDRSEDVEVTVRQEKIKNTEEQYTEIIIEYP
jgi:hypothetical protein